MLNSPLPPRSVPLRAGRVVQERTESVRGLPAWPLGLLLVGFPLWWLLGLGTFAVAIVGAIMAMLMAQLRPVALPRGFALWVFFLVFVLGASLELDSGTRLIGYGVRVLAYLGAASVFLYVVNARDSLPRERVLKMICFFLGFVVLGGYLGVLFPHGSITTVVEHLLPKRIDANTYVQSLVHPAFAEVQTPYGSPTTFVRPSAPFPYTNSWGVNAALLVPLVASAFALSRGVWSRIGIAVLLVAGLPPALATLNRGMFLAIGVALIYVALRLAFRGRVTALLWIIGLGAGAVVVAVATGALSSLNNRLQYSQSNDSRTQIYHEAFQGALRSPLFGNGAPQPSDTLQVSVGTQGQLWNVMFSYGFPALVFFVGFFVFVLIASWNARSVAALWINAVAVVVLFTIVFYGYDGPQLAIAMIAAALAVRGSEDPESVAPRRRAPLRIAGVRLSR